MYIKDVNKNQGQACDEDTRKGMLDHFLILFSRFKNAKTYGDINFFNFST